MLFLLEELPPFLRSSLCFLLVSPHLRRADAPLVRHLVPEANHRLGPIGFVPHRTETGRSEQEVPARPRAEPEPPRGQHSEKMPTPKEPDVPPHCPDPSVAP